MGIDDFNIDRPITSLHGKKSVLLASLSPPREKEYIDENK